MDLDIMERKQMMMLKMKHLILATLSIGFCHKLIFNSFNSNSGTLVRMHTDNPSNRRIEQMQVMADKIHK